MEYLGLESAVAGVFMTIAVVGFKKSLWTIVAALAGHGFFDFFHGSLIQNRGVPVWLARILPFIRRWPRLLPCRAADATLRIRPFRTVAAMIGSLPILKT